MKQKPIQSVWLLCGLMLLLVGQAFAQDTSYTPVFEEGACASAMPADVEYTCGTVIVPEDRTNPDGAQVRLAVAIIRHPSGTPESDPVIYLEGGPGGSALAQLNFSYPLLFKDLHEESNRDMIFFDQRGVGLSEPALTCPEVNEISLELYDYELDGETLTFDEVSDAQADALVACGERLQGEANLASYTTRENAHDVFDIAAALDIDEVNLLGISYGSKLALQVMRDYPDLVRSSIIDAVVPMDVDLISTLTRNANRAFNVLFDRCEADEVCHTAYPNLRDTFWELYEDLNETPVILEVLNPGTGMPITGVVFDGYGLVSYLFTYLYQTDLLPSLPKLIYDIQAGDYRSVTTLIQLSIQQLDIITIGMTVAFQCQDEFPFTDEATALSDATVEQRIGEVMLNVLNGGLSFDYCGTFALADVDPTANEAVVSDIPTLVMSGEFDPITPPENGDIAARTLANSYVYTFPGTGHGASPSGVCPVSIVGQFLSDPASEPDASCIATMDKPQFITGDTPPPVVTLVEMVLANGNNILIPDGWLEVQAGTFVRQNTPIDQTTVLVLNDLPVGQDVFVLSFAASLGAAPPEVETTISNENGDWDLYALEFQGYPAQMAVTATDEGLQVVVFIIDDANEIDYLTNEALLPMIASYNNG